jgi:thiol-disulfide isomerase/thioredoxin
LPSPSTPSSADDTAEPRRFSRGTLIALIVGSLAIPGAALALILRDNGATSTDPATEGVLRLPPEKGKVGTFAPDFTLPTLDGRDVTLSSLRGKPVVLTFFASWCNPCEKDMPALQRLQDDNRDRLAVIGVNFKDFREDTRQFVERLGVGFPALIENSTTNPVAVRYDVHAMPDTVFIDADGVVRDRLFGETSLDDLEAATNRLLQR